MQYRFDRQDFKHKAINILTSHFTKSVIGSMVSLDIRQDTTGLLTCDWVTEFITLVSNMSPHQFNPSRETGLTAHLHVLWKQWGAEHTLVNSSKHSLAHFLNNALMNKLLQHSKQNSWLWCVLCRHKFNNTFDVPTEQYWFVCLTLIITSSATSEICSKGSNPNTKLTANNQKNFTARWVCKILFGEICTWRFWPSACSHR